MTNTTHTPEENLAFLRQLAHSGKEAPLMGGPYLIAGGAWFAAASLLQWPPLRDLLGLSLIACLRKMHAPLRVGS